MIIIEKNTKLVIEIGVAAIVLFSMFVFIQLDPFSISYDGDFGVNPEWEEPVYDEPEPPPEPPPDNIAPTATILSISPISTEQTAYITFVGTGTDSDGYVKRYIWKSSIDGTLSNQKQFTKSASDLSIGTHTIKFKTIDDDGAHSAWATKIIKIIATNKAPIARISSVSPLSAVQGTDTILFRGFGEDSDGTIAAYQWSSNLDNELSKSKDFNIPAEDLSIGTHTISLKVKDNKGAWSTAAITTIVINAREEEDNDQNWWDDQEDDQEDVQDETDLGFSSFTYTLIFGGLGIIAIVGLVLVIKRISRNKS